MPSTNTSKNLSCNASATVRGKGDFEYSSSGINNAQTLRSHPSAFSAGLSGRPPAIDTGYSDDSDLPRLSPIRTSSESAIHSIQKKQKMVSVEGRSSLSRSCFYEGSIKNVTLTARDSSDFSVLGSGSLTATSGAYSALSDDAWQSNTPSEQTNKQNQPVVQQEVALGHQRSKSSISAFFDNLSTALNQGFYNLAVKVERATSTATREFASGMRSATSARPDCAFFEVKNPLPDKSRDTGLFSEVAAASPEITAQPILPQISYDTSFNLCGGQDLYEELELVCNGYAKKLNKLRSQLSDEGKDRLDGLLTCLYPIFDIVGSPSDCEDEGIETTIDERLSFLHSPIDFLAGQSMSSASLKERSAVLDIAKLVANPVNVLGSITSFPLTPQTSRCAELFVELDSAVYHGKHSAELIHDEGVQSVAELSSNCVKCLLEIANELVLPPNSPSRLQWPREGAEIGRLLRSFVIRLVHNIESVTGSFVGALLGVGCAYDENLQDCSVGQKANGLACDLEMDSGTAVMKIQESLRNLMYVVVYVTFES